eukprot:sb/3473218/
MIENIDMELEDDDIPPPPPAQKQSTTPPYPPPPDLGSDKKMKKSVKREKQDKTFDLAQKQKVKQDIANIVKLALKIPFKKRKISKDDYKLIMKQVVLKVYESRHVKRGDPLRADKITEMVAAYIKQTQHKKTKEETNAAAAGGENDEKEVEQDS